jgi:hypothetical protein
MSMSCMAIAALCFAALASANEGTPLVYSGRGFRAVTETTFTVERDGIIAHLRPTKNIFGEDEAGVYFEASPQPTIFLEPTDTDIRTLYLPDGITRITILGNGVNVMERSFDQPMAHGTRDPARKCVWSGEKDLGYAGVLGIRTRLVKTHESDAGDRYVWVWEEGGCAELQARSTRYAYDRQTKTRGKLIEDIFPSWSLWNWAAPRNGPARPTQRKAGSQPRWSGFIKSVLATTTAAS